jgi:hypothetical protein
MPGGSKFELPATRAALLFSFIPMAAPLFSPLTPRWCGWCQQPLQGRSDKQFCSAACRGKAARHGVVDGDPIDWPARAAQAEQTVQHLQAHLAQLAQDHQTVAPLERRYDEFTQMLNVLIPEVRDAGLLPNVLHFVEQLLGDYGQHPGLAMRAPGPHLRLQLVQQVHGTLQRQLSYLTPRVPSGTRGPGATP